MFFFLYLDLKLMSLLSSVMMFFFMKIWLGKVGCFFLFDLTGMMMKLFCFKFLKFKFLLEFFVKVFSLVWVLFFVFFLFSWSGFVIGGMIFGFLIWFFLTDFFFFFIVVVFVISCVMFFLMGNINFLGSIFDFIFFFRWDLGVFGVFFFFLLVVLISFGVIFFLVDDVGNIIFFGVMFMSMFF